MDAANQRIAALQQQLDAANQRIAALQQQLDAATTPASQWLSYLVLGEQEDSSLFTVQREP